MPAGLCLSASSADAVAGTTCTRKSVLPQPAQDVVFHAVIEGDDGNVRRRQRFAHVAGVGVRALPRTRSKCRALLVLFVPAKRLLVRDFLDVIHADKDKFLRAPHGLRVRNFLRGNESVHRAAHAQFFGQRPRVNALNAGNAVFLQIFRQRKIRAPVADDRRQFADDKTGDVRPPRFHVHVVDAVIADERIRHRDDLAFVGRVGEDFLVAGHGRVETDLAARGGARAKTLSVKNRAVFEGQNCFHHQNRGAMLEGPAKRSSVKRIFTPRPIRSSPTRPFCRRQWSPRPCP